MAKELRFFSPSLPLGVAINSSVTSLTLTGASTYFRAFTAGDYFFLKITEGAKSEIVKATAYNAGVLTITRGRNPQSFSTSANAIPRPSIVFDSFGLFRFDMEDTELLAFPSALTIIENPDIPLQFIQGIVRSIGTVIPPVDVARHRLQLIDIASGRIRYIAGSMGNGNDAIASGRPIDLRVQFMHRTEGNGAAAQIYSHDQVAWFFNNVTNFPQLIVAPGEKLVLDWRDQRQPPAASVDTYKWTEMSFIFSRNLIP